MDQATLTEEPNEESEDRREALMAALEERGQPEEEKEAAAEEPDENPVDASAEEAPDEEPEEEKPARQYPSSWKKDYEPIFQKLAENEELAPILDEIERREADFHKGIENYKQAAQFAQTMQQAIEPYMANIRAAGVSPDVAVSALFAADHALRTSPPQTKLQILAKIASDYGVDLSQLTNSEGEAQQPDPYIQQMEAKIQQLEQQTRQIGSTWQQQQMASLNSEIEQFAQGKEHFEAVREDMAALLQAGRAANLDEAYEMAIWANPEVRQALVQKQQREAEEKRKEELKKAKAAASSVAGSPSAGSDSNPSPKDRHAYIASLMAGT